MFEMKRKSDQAKMITIHAVGDSHAVFCFDNLTACSTHWLGPVTMYNIGRGGLRSLDLGWFDTKPTDAAIFVFGEIDVRCHLELAAQRLGKSIDDVVAELVKNYLSTINENRKIYNLSHWIVSNVIPPSNRKPNQKYPFFGQLATRIEITQKLNACIKTMCEKQGFLYFDLYTLFASPLGHLTDDLSDGHVHVAPNATVRIGQRLREVLTEAGLDCTNVGIRSNRRCIFNFVYKIYMYLIKDPRTFDRYGLNFCRNIRLKRLNG
jgi:hypothetical protein